MDVSEPAAGRIEWYMGISKEQGLAPRCPFASVHRCPRYFANVSLMGTAGNTAIDPQLDADLEAHWKETDVWPVTSEQDTSIGGRPGEPHIFSRFCPEVSFENFGWFASHLARYADEADVDHAQSWLAREGVPVTDSRWLWAQMTPMHYTACPLYALLLKGVTPSAPKRHIGFDTSAAAPSQP